MSFLVIVGSGVPLCGCFRRIILLIAVVAVGVLSLSLAYPCRRRRRRLLIFGGVSLLLSLSESRCRFWSLVVVAVSSLSSVASLLMAAYVGFCASLLLSSSESHRRRWHILVSDGVLLLLFSASCLCCHFRRCCRWRWRVLCKRLFYTRLTMYATTMETQYQAQNGPVALLVVWQLDLVWPSPQCVNEVY